MTTTEKLAEALREAATSLETIALSAGYKFDSEGQENYLRHFDQVRGYANSRATVAIAALAAWEVERAAPAGQIGEVVEMDDGCRHVVWRDGTPEPGTKLYTTPAAPADFQDAQRWRTFIGLPYETRAEWAVNLSLTPTLISWVDSATKEQTP
jgi:hypothetical protein